LALSGKELPDMKLFDLGQNFIRPQLATVAGAARTLGGEAKFDALFRASLTATVVVEGARDSVAADCRVVAIEWQRLAGATSYQVQVRVG
jgi:hypothetical protein